MKLSQRGQYAVRALIALGMSGGKAVLSSQQISDQQKIPKRFLEQILIELKGAGLVESKRGVAGGYRLRRRADQIHLAEVIRHIEGPLAPVSCVSERFYERCTCPDESKCGIRSVMQEVRAAIVGILEGITVTQLCDRVRQLQGPQAGPFDYVI
jgi:Rrf2 family protein